MFDAFSSYYKKDNSSFFMEKRYAKGFNLFELAFTPMVNEYGKISNFYSTHMRIRVKIFRDKITFSGSFHTSSKGHNACQFNYTELRTLMRFLKIKFGDIFMKSKITSLEYGLLVAEDLVDWIRYKQNYCQNMTSRGRVYGKRLCMSDFELKRYDKLLQMTLSNKNHIESLPKDGFRVEVKIRRMRSIQEGKFPVPINIMEDILVRKNIESLHQDFERKLKRVWKESSAIDNAFKEDKELLKMYGTLSYEKANNLYKERFPSSHKYWRKKISDLVSDLTAEYEEELSFKLEEHLKFIIT